MVGSPAWSAPRSLARLSSVSAASITGVLHTLEGDGLVKRRRSRVDRRSFELELTKKGRGIVVEQFRVNNERERLWAEALTRREQDTLARLLRKLLAYHPPEE